MLIIKCSMLKVKNLSLLSQKMKKRREFWPRLQKMELCSILLQPSVALWLDFNQNFVLYRMKVILGR